MTETETKPKPITPLNYRLQLILFFVTVTLWEPFYNMFCFNKLNELDSYPKLEGVPSTKNSVLINILLVLTIVGAPIAYYRRYKLLREYIYALNPYLEPPPKQLNKKGEEIEGLRANCIEEKKFVGYIITTFFSIAIFAASFVVGLIYLLQNSITQPSTGNLWVDGAYMIIFLIGINMLFICVGFSVRTAIEERKWFNAFNLISMEVMKKNNIQLPKVNVEKEHSAE